MRAYLSHSIRGKKGQDATDEDMMKNNRKAIEFAENIRSLFPCLDLYVPAEHDEFVLNAYRRGYLGEPEILDVDCMIVQTCNFLIALAPEGYISRGMQVEIDYANTHGIPVVVVDGYTGTAADVITAKLHDMMR